MYSILQKYNILFVEAIFGALFHTENHYGTAMLIRPHLHEFRNLPSRLAHFHKKLRFSAEEKHAHREITL